MQGLVGGIDRSAESGGVLEGLREHLAEVQEAPDVALDIAGDAVRQLGSERIDQNKPLLKLTADEQQVVSVQRQLVFSQAQGSQPQTAFRP